MHQVGVEKFRIDLGVRHESYPSGYIAGIECDGASYHSHYTVRDRDRIRQSVLEQLGWRIWRVWSTDWFNNPDREFGRLAEWLDQLRDEAIARYARMAEAEKPAGATIQIPTLAPTQPYDSPQATAPEDASGEPVIADPVVAEPKPMPDMASPPPSPTGRLHETPGDGIPFYEDLSLPGFFEVWSGADVIGTVERVGGAAGAAKVFGGAVRAPLPEYVATRNWDNTTFRARDIYAAVRQLVAEYKEKNAAYS